MKLISQNFKNEISQLGRQYDVIIQYINDSQTITITKRMLYSVSFNNYAKMLKSVMKELEFECINKISKDTILNIKIGILVNDSYEYLDFGNYIVYEEPEYYADTKTYYHICYDKMLYSMKDYEKLDVTYPITIKEYLNAISTKLGLSFANINDTFVNCDKKIKNELYENLGYTYRDVLDELSQVTASNICINKNDELEIRYITETNDVIDSRFFKDKNVTFSQKYGPINSIVLSRSAEADNIFEQDEESVKNGLCEIKIKDNQIMNFEDRIDYLHEIFDKLNGIEYYINDYDSPGILYYDLCDRYTINVHDTTYSCVIFNDEISIADGISETIYTDVPETSQTDYTKSSKTEKETTIIADKQKQEIKMLASNVKENTESITNITTTKKTITDKEIYIDDAVNTNVLKNVIYGKCEQATRSGKNLILIDDTSLGDKTINGITITNLGSGTFKLNGTSTSAVSLQISRNMKSLSKNFVAGDYTLSCEVNGSISDNITIILYGTNGAEITSISCKNSSYVNKSLVKSYDDYYYWLYIPSGRTINNAIIKTMLISGHSTTMPSYEPYGASPSPDYPSEIDVVDGYRNLFSSAIEQSALHANNGTTYDDPARIRTKDFIVVKGGEKYVLSYNENLSFYTFYYDENETFISNGGQWFNSGNYFTVPNNANYVKMSFKNSSDTNITPNDISNIMLNYTLKNYVPYGNWLVEKITGKNLLNAPYTEDNKLTKTATKNDDYTNTNYYAELETGKTYTFSCKTTGTYGNNNTYQTECFLLFEKAYNYIILMGDKNGFIFKPKQTGKYYLRYDVNISGETHSFWDFQIEEGTEPTEYEPYKENTVLTDLNIYDNEGNIIGHHELCSIGDIEDELEVTTGLLTKRIGKLVLDGSETITTRSNTSETHNKFVFANILPYETRNSISLISSHFETNNKANTADASINCICSNSSSNYKKYLYISIEKSIASTVNDFKTWLSNNPVTIYYELAEPQTIQLTPTNVTLFEGVNHISLVDDLETNITLDYLVKTLLSDTYYSKTEAKAEIDITANEIKQQVSEISNETTKLNQQIQTVDESVSTISTNLNNNYLTSDEINAQMKTNKDDISHLQQQMSEISQTVSDYNINFSTMAGTIKEMNYNFNTDRLQIAKSDDPINSTFDNKGVKIFNYSTLTTIFSDKGTGVDKLIVTGSAQIGYLKFVKNYKNGKKCTTIHVLDKLIEDLSDLESD